uniref:Activating signal cointegrator 1 complex subunit 3 n=1 Tax=Acrobeloides nanus TaxID=290746 RepID=A0A914CEE6_9BILA
MNENPSTSQQLSKISVPKIDDSTFHVLRQALETTLRTSLQRNTVDLEPKYDREFLQWYNSEFELIDVQETKSSKVQKAEPSASNGTSSRASDILTLEDLIQVVNYTNEDSETLLKHLISLLRSPHGNEEIQNDLIDLLGVDHFELIGKILLNRISLTEEINEGYMKRKKLRRELEEGVILPNMPTASSIIVQTGAQKALRKELIKEQKKAKKELNKIVAALDEDEKFELEATRREQERLRELEIRQEKFIPTFAPSSSMNPNKEKLPYVFDSMDSGPLTNVLLEGVRYCLPEGTKRKNTFLYEEVYVPPVEQGNAVKVNKIKTKTLDPHGRLAFEGTEELNTIQSIVFEQAYNTLENLLICAPTGAGKTNIAMLTVLKTIRDHCTPQGEINKGAFKIIYIAPMKALATEMTSNFAKRLDKLGLKVRELTGDTTLTKREISETSMLILTPEKWDVVTRKADDEALTQLVRLLIIDEVHLLHDDRGPVIETIVSRTLRQMEIHQQKVRIVGLSATLPNYIDVAKFLKVDPMKGLFFFDGRFRPVPLAQSFLGIHTNVDKSRDGQRKMMDDACYEKCMQFLKEDHQVLVFVHARNATSQVARSFIDKATLRNEMALFLPSNIKSREYLNARKALNKSNNREIDFLFQHGFGIHHAGLVRSDRHLMERMFLEGHIRILVCTATLAWGVNLPAHAVIIRGTEIFDPQKGVFTDIGVLDVQQIFGRAGRPQYETMGHGVIITTIDKITKYVSMLIRQTPIESQFKQRILDNLNAEVARGTVSTIPEAVEWLRYTYFYVRLKKNPFAYGVNWSDMTNDPDLSEYLTDFCYKAAEQLDKNKMIRFDRMNMYLSPTDLGRIASHYYVTYETIEMINSGEGEVKFSKVITDEVILALISQSSEFSQVKAREEEMMDISELLSTGCMLPIRGADVTSSSGKANCLLQSYISQAFVSNFALISETFYVAQNAPRLCRAFFEIALRNGWSQATTAILNMSKYIERRLWNWQHPLWQFPGLLKDQTIMKIENCRMNFSQLLELSARDLGSMFSCDGQKVYEALRILPRLEAEATIKPITATIIQINAVITPVFTWYDRVFGTGGVLRFWVLIEDVDENMILHYEPLLLPRKKVRNQEPQRLVFTIPIRDQQISHQYQLRVTSDNYIVEDTIEYISLKNYQMPTAIRPHTDLLSLNPLPLKTLKHPDFENMYNFQFFNPIQTQVFFCLYNTDNNALIGAPTGSGKTLCAELAMFRVLKNKPGKKCVYIAPLKALVRERVLDWRKKFDEKMKIKIVEVSGDHTPDLRTLEAASILITTPEKWDGITRSWETRDYVKNVELVIIDEIHLLGVERGAVLEAIITRLKLIARKRELDKLPVRLVGLSTALANAADVADWLGIKEEGLYNFRPNVRPVPIQVHIQGFPGQHYCPRMALMNKPAFKAIKEFSPIKPTLLFVASRRQTRLTAMAFVSMLAMEDDPKQWLHMDMQELQTVVESLKDDNLKLTLPFGIGMHHAGLQQYERNIVEKLFVERKIQVLIATATLAWGINVPAHLVIVKGTEFYDGKTHKYVDFPVTDVLQMIGRAGRPQYDDSAVAVVYVQDVKKNFYKKFLYEPFPVESSLLPVLPNHVNAELCAGTVQNRQQILDYIAGTYLYRRMFANPAYYGIEDTSSEGMVKFLVQVVDDSVRELLTSRCIVFEEDEDTLKSTPLGRICSQYYLQHISIRHFAETLRPGLTIVALLEILADTPEYSEIPVRHNEDKINEELQYFLPIKLPIGTDFESPHTKVHLLYQAHFSRAELPVDYFTDLRSILDACIRILQAMLDISLVNEWLDTALNVIILLQQIIQGRWYNDHPLMCLPNLSEHSIEVLAFFATIPQYQNQLGIDQLSYPLEKRTSKIVKDIMDKTILDDHEAKEVVTALMKWPIIRVREAHFLYQLDDCPIDLGLFDERTADWIPLNTSTHYKLRLRLESLGPYRMNSEAYCPKFPKEKTAGWIVLMGEKKTNKIMGFTKIPPICGKTEIRLDFKTPDMPGSYKFTFFLMSDSYLGIDQEYDIFCHITIKNQ